MNSRPSDYERVRNDLTLTRCHKCRGSGEVDDAEPGDISYRTYKCGDCNGSGFRNDMRYMVVRASVAKRGYKDE